MHRMTAFAHRIFIFATAALILAGAGHTALAQPAPARIDPAPGDYQAEGGAGRLTVTRQGPASLRFRLRAEGPNGHSCALDGEILAGVASLAPDGAREICRVFFGREGDAVAVSTNGADACRYYCGARASFEGAYRLSIAGCAEPARRAARRSFKALYDAGDHAKALATLQPLLDRCAATMPWLEAGWIRNDVALTQLKLGAPRDCLRTLEPLRADAARSEAEIRAAYPPSDADRYLSILRATRSNAGRCEAATP